MVVRVISIPGSDSIRPSMKPVINANTQPTITPPTNTNRNSPVPLTSTSEENSPAVSRPIRIVASTSDVASLNRLSPSTNMVNLSGTPSCLKIAITATGSVALMIAPNNSPTIKSKSVNTEKMKPMMHVEISSPGIASVRIGQRLLETWRALRLNADSKISVGMKTKRTSSGVS